MTVSVASGAREMRTRRLHFCAGLFLGLQISQQALECLAVRVMVLPITEIRDEVFADLARRILAGVSVKVLPSLNALERNQANRKKDSTVFVQFFLARVSNLGFDPLAIHAVIRQNE